MRSVSISRIGAELYRSHKAFNRGATVFIGAGASVSSGIPDWETIANKLCEEYALPRKKKSSAVRTVIDNLGNRKEHPERFILLQDILKGKDPSLGYHHLAQLASSGYISTILTTNWDSLLETAIFQHVKSDRVRIYARGLIPDDRIAEALKYSTNDEISIVKLHGDIASRYFFIKPEEVRRFGNELVAALQACLDNPTYIVGTSASDVDILNTLLSRGENAGTAYITLFNPQKQSQITSLIEDSGVKTVLGKQKVVTRNSKKVNIGDFDHFFTQLNLAIRLKLISDNIDQLNSIEANILSKEKVGLRYINNTQIGEYLQRFWLDIKSLNPDKIVFINDPLAPGGVELKRRLLPRLNESKISCDEIIITGQSGSRTFKRGVVCDHQCHDTATVQRVVILDAITFSGNTLKLAKEEVEKWYPKAIVTCGVLVVSQHYKEQCGADFSDIVYNQVTDRFEIFFPWGVTQTTSDFVRKFTGMSEELNVVINKRPWGAVEELVNTRYCSVRLLVMEANNSLSFQRHLCRDELYVALDDHIHLQIGGYLSPENKLDKFHPSIKSLILEKGDYILIPKGVWHRPAASMDRARILEVAFGVYDQQYDIERLDDMFMRENADGAE